MCQYIEAINTFPMKEDTAFVHLDGCGMETKTKRKTILYAEVESDFFKEAPYAHNGQPEWTFESRQARSLRRSLPWGRKGVNTPILIESRKMLFSCATHPGNRVAIVRSQQVF